MGKIKGWNKVRNTKKVETWINDIDNDTYVELVKTPKDCYLRFSNRITRRGMFANSSEARTYAIKYMKKYPKGY